MLDAVGVEVLGENVIFGEKGLVRLRYKGDVAGKFRGAYTCRWYEFARERRERYVDARDVEGFLARRGVEGENLFEVVS